MKVAVLGAGAIGSMFGGLVKHHAPEIDVVLIGRGEHGEAMKRQGGVRLLGSWGNVTAKVHVSDSVSDISGSDFVLLTVKSYSTVDALRQAEHHLDQAVVISLQNGINQPVLARFVAGERLVMGMTATKIAVQTPGTVSMERNDSTVIGPADETMPSDRLDAAVGLLQKSRLKVNVDRHVVGAQYNKLIFNTLGAAASLSDLDFLRDGILNGEWRRTVAIPVQRESLDVLVQSGVRLGRIPGAPDVYRFGRLMRTLNVPVLGRLFAAIMGRVIRKPIRFSLAYDLAAGKRTEIDFINGEVLRLADKTQIDAPLNRRIVDLVHEREEVGGFLSRDQVVAEIRKLHRSRG